MRFYRAGDMSVVWALGKMGDVFSALLVEVVLCRGYCPPGARRMFALARDGGMRMWSHYSCYGGRSDLCG